MAYFSCIELNASIFNSISPVIVMKELDINHTVLQEFNLVNASIFNSISPVIVMKELDINHTVQKCNILKKIKLR